MLFEEYSKLADAARDQYFLVAPDKLAAITEAAGIRTTDRVIELGAGVGTVARTLPPCQRLIVIELDSRLIPELRANVPDATVINDDGVALLREGKLTADVVISNLPTVVTQSLIAILPTIAFRTAVLSVGSMDDLDDVSAKFEHRYLTTIEGDDFVPPQPGKSYLMRIEPKTTVTHTT